MAEHPQLGSGEPSGIHAAGVNQTVHNDHITRAHQGRDRASGRGMTRRKSQRGLRAEELGERFLEMVMHRQRSADESRCGRSGAPVVHRPDRGLQHGGMQGEPEVIVARERNQPVSTGLQHRRRTLIHRPQGSPQSLGTHRLQALAQGFLERLGHGRRMAGNPRPGHAQR